jgi:hypothetical protein
MNRDHVAGLRNTGSGGNSFVWLGRRAVVLVASIHGDMELGGECRLTKQGDQKQ